MVGRDTGAKVAFHETSRYIKGCEQANTVIRVIFLIYFW